MPSAPGRRVDATVKWFNPSKGFGFVTMADGTQDAFLPMAILRRAGYDDVREGSSITCEIGAGAKGPLVINVLSIDASTAVAPRPNGSDGGFDRRPPRPAQTLEGAVKWFGPRRATASSRPMAAARTSSFTSRRCAAASSMRSSRASGSGSRWSRAEKGLEADRIELLSDLAIALSRRPTSPRRPAAEVRQVAAACAQLIPAMRMHALPPGLQT